MGGQILESMKKIINVAIGGCSFVIDEEAYNTLDNYIIRFKEQQKGKSSGSDAVYELENRIADLLKERLGNNEVVDDRMAQEVTGMLGYAESVNPAPKGCYSGTDGERPVRRLFRDPDGKKIAGVCSGIALFLGVDVTLLRIIFLVALICGSAGFWIYLVIWIASPEARNAEEKCELRGLPLNEENLKRFSKEI